MRALTPTTLLLALVAGAVLGRGAARRLRRPEHSGHPASRLDPAATGVPRTLLSEADGEAVYLHYQAGSELLDSGNPAQATVRLEKARALAPEWCSIREALGRAYFAVGRLPEAECEFREVIGRSPSDDYAHYCLSRTLKRLGRGTEAGAHLKLARALRPDDPRYVLSDF